MSEFKPIETQEQFDEMIKERLARAESKAAERYADYDDLKAQLEEKTKQLTDLSAQLKENDEKAAGSSKEIEELKARVQKYELASVKTKIALEEGLPYQMADRLAGEDEKAIRADAQKVAKIMRQDKAPVGSGEPVITKEQTSEQQFKDWFDENLK